MSFVLTVRPTSVIHHLRNSSHEIFRFTRKKNDDSCLEEDEKLAIFKPLYKLQNMHPQDKFFA